ncbi:MAG: rhodanese-like domain-containing protein [Bacteroidales bacterium]
MKLRILFSIIILVLTIQLPGQHETCNKYISAGPEDFLTLIRFKENTVLIDVRLPFEYRREHIENSINIPIKLSHKKFIRRVNFIPKDKVILVYCESDVRSINAARRLFDAGYKTIYVLEGGTIGWKRKMLPLVGKRVEKTDTQ